MSGPVLGRTGFSRIFILRAAGYFRGYCCRIFISSFLWGKVRRKILQENPRQNPPEFAQKAPTHFCRGPISLLNELGCLPGKSATTKETPKALPPPHCLQREAQGASSSWHSRHCLFCHGWEIKALVSSIATAGAWSTRLASAF